MFYLTGLLSIASISAGDGTFYVKTGTLLGILPMARQSIVPQRTQKIRSPLLDQSFPTNQKNYTGNILQTEKI
jgi:hypothetical protein